MSQGRSTAGRKIFERTIGRFSIPTGRQDDFGLWSTKRDNSDFVFVVDRGVQNGRNCTFHSGHPVVSRERAACIDDKVGMVGKLVSRLQIFNPQLPQPLSLTTNSSSSMLFFPQPYHLLPFDSPVSQYLPQEFFLLFKTK